jgi:hypothetical protein
MLMSVEVYLKNIFFCILNIFYDKILPSLIVTPVPAMLNGRGLRTGVVLRFTPELVVDVDMALPGREADKLFGVISPDRRPRS